MTLLLRLLALLASLSLAVRALDWSPHNNFRVAQLPVPATGKTGFTLLPANLTGITFTNLLPIERHLTNQILLNGSGVAAGDVDGDGWCDLYFCAAGGHNALYRNLGNWKFEDITVKAGVALPNIDCTGAAFVDLDGDGDLDLIVNSIGAGTHVFLNDGNGKFTLTARLNLGKGGMSLAFADIDGDGFLDFYVANYRTLGLVDMPNTKFWLKPVNGQQVISTVNGRPVTDPDLTNRFIINAHGGVEELGEADVLYHNLGGTNFVPISWSDGSFLDEDGKPLQKPPFDWGLSVMFRDINGDGLPDIYVCNDFDTPDRIWINQGHGKFRALPRLALRKLTLFSMGVDFADINRDGYDDIFVLDMLSRRRSVRMTQQPDRSVPMAIPGLIDNRPQYSMNTLFLNRGDGTYAEIAQLSGLAASEWSWTPLFLDVDLDGWEDLLISNGHEREARNIDVMEELRLLRTQRQMSPSEILQARRRIPRLLDVNLAFRNQHDLTFADMSREWGFTAPTVSHGMVLADLDNDGDLDLIVNNLNAPASIYRNDSIAPRIAVRLKGASPNTRGIGARIKVAPQAGRVREPDVPVPTAPHSGFGAPASAGRTPTVLSGPPLPIQSQEIIAGGRYLSSDDPMRVFAAGSLSNRFQIEVVWRTGRRSTIIDAKPNCIYEIAEPATDATGTASLSPRERAGVRGNSASDSTRPPIFQDASRLLSHIHHEDSFDDFDRQPTLERKLSQLGPGIAWTDFDGDGWDDLIIGTGKGGAIAFYRNDRKGGFVREQNSFAPVEDDTTMILGWRQSPTQYLVLAGIGNYESTGNTPSPVRILDRAGKTSVDMTTGINSTLGPLAMADINGDGNLDLFVGSRCLPGKYPMSDASVVLKNVKGQFEIDVENTKQLSNAGMVSAAVFSDLNGDGLPDLILARDWGPIRIFRNDAGKLLPWDAPVTLNSRLSTLNQLTGWWNGIATGDFDGDGRLDIIASNWGRNTPYQARRSQPLKLFYGDIDDIGKTDLLYTSFDPDLGAYAPERQLGFLNKSIRFISERFTTHASFAKANIQEILADRMPRVQSLEAAWLESTLFLNRGDHFEAHPLPVEAQISPAFAVCVGDFDGDGNEDLFLSQNFFSQQPDIPRYDAGRGLLLRGQPLLVGPDPRRQGSHILPGQSHKGRHQGQRGDHGDHHDQRRGQAECADESQSGK